MDSSSASHINSYYAASAVGMVDYPELSDTENCDVCVIGGGFTGLSTALNLAELGFDVVLLEARRIGWGASGRNGGQVGSGLNWSQTELEADFGVEAAHALWDLCEQAKQEVTRRIRQHQISCDFKHGTVAAAVTRKAAKTYQEEADHLREKYDCKAIRFVDREEISELLGTNRYWAGMLDSSTGHLHPLNFAIGLARAATEAKVRIHENSPVVGYTRDGDGYSVTTSRGSVVKSRFVVFGCNAYMDGVAMNFSKWIMPFVSCVAATEPLDESVAQSINRDDVAVYDSRFCLDYYRLTSDRRLLFGGAENYIPTESGNIARRIRSRILHLYPTMTDVKIDYAWGGKIAATRSRLPSVGRIDENTYYAQGYSGHGVALTNIVGRSIAEAIADQPERFERFASVPHKTFPGGRFLRWPAHVLTMLSLSALDRLSVRIGGVR